MSQGTLVSRYVSYVDKNSKLLIADKKGNEDKEVERICNNFSSRKGDKGHNAAEISRIMTGKSLFNLSINVNSISVIESAKLFNDNMSSLFFDEDKPLLMLSLLDIFNYDEKNRNNLRESFAESIEGEGISFPRFMIELLLLSAENIVSHKEQRDCLETIAASHITKSRKKNNYLLDNSPILKAHIDTVQKKYSGGTYTWDKNSQTLRIIDKSFFQGNKSENSEKDNTSSLSSISIPKEYCSCRFCQKVEINECEANDSNSPYLGICLSLKQEILKNHNVCNRFSPNYSAITTQMLKSKITQ